MTFERFIAVAKRKYPNAEILPHGNDNISKTSVSVRYELYGKTYSYRGTYEQILVKMGYNIISKEREKEYRKRLEELKAVHGTTDIFFNSIIDNTAEIEEIERILKNTEVI